MQRRGEQVQNWIYKSMYLQEEQWAKENTESSAIIQRTDKSEAVRNKEEMGKSKKGMKTNKTKKTAECKPRKLSFMKQ